MTFTQWMNRPVYKAQCATFREALRLLKIDHKVVKGGIATNGAHPLDEFRVLPAYRTAQSLALRKAVADRVRTWRSLYRDANHLAKRYRSGVGMWQDGNNVYIRFNPDADCEAQRNGWTLMFSVPLK